ncbi:MAG TPA: hypothetical protein VN844_17750 [Pyrinomonadaceae bacterium]|nr:hypothetical protein [Pyrinomonadaceae bacterium]
MSIFSPHIPFTELVDLADEKSATSDEVLEHLFACSHCSGQLEKVRQTIGLMRSDTIENPPPNLVESARRLFRSSQQPSGLPSLATRVIAALSFDSLVAAPAFGLRSQTSGDRQLLYSTETADIELRVSPENEIAGQILGATCEYGEVNLESDSFTATARLNEVCEFFFGSVPAGTYKISVHLPGMLVDIPQLELGP